MFGICPVEFNDMFKHVHDKMIQKRLLRLLLFSSEIVLKYI